MLVLKLSGIQKIYYNNGLLLDVEKKFINKGTAFAFFE